MAAIARQLFGGRALSSGESIFARSSELSSNAGVVEAIVADQAGDLVEQTKPFDVGFSDGFVAFVDTGTARCGVSFTVQSTLRGCWIQLRRFLRRW